MISLVYQSESWSGRFDRADAETADLGFFDPLDLPEMNPFNRALLPTWQSRDN